MSYRVIGCIPAGRRRYMELLVPHLLREKKSFNSIQLWANTLHVPDLEYLHGLATAHPGFFQVIMPKERPSGIQSICHFWRQATDPDAIYVRTDDDIVWIAPNAIQTLVNYRVAYPQPFLVFGNTVNNVICNHLHQRLGCIPTSAGITSHEDACPVAWRSPQFAELAHRSFLMHLANGRTEDYRFRRWILLNYQRCGINACCWFGRDLRKEDPIEMRGEEEHWVTRVRPRQLGRLNEICGDALFVHFAYFPQRSHLDGTDLLECYRRYAPTGSEADVAFALRRPIVSRT